MAEHGNLQVFISRSVKFCELHLCLQDYDAVWEFREAFAAFRSGLDAYQRSSEIDEDFVK